MTAPEVKVTQADIYAAAIQWCGEKDRETSLDDVRYFQENWQHTAGFRSRVEAFARHRIAATTAQLDALREAREAVEAFAVALENSDFANVAHELNSQMCCDGHMCGCRGSTVGEYLAHELRATLTLTAAIARAEGA